jgi:uncharacterized iron-regulated membrane protein
MSRGFNRIMLKILRVFLLALGMVGGFGYALCFAQTSSLTDQINAVSAAQDQEQAAQAAAQAEQQAEERAEEARQQALEEQHLAAQPAAQRRQDAAAAAAAAAVAAENKRQQDFQDEQQELVIAQQKIDLQEQQTIADRENDIINHTLKQQDAQTDLVQSQADSTRDIASGTKTLLQDTGQAELKKP